MNELFEKNWLSAILLRDNSHLLILSKAATILRLLGNETIHFNTRGKKSEPDLRKQLNIEVKSTTKFKFFSLNILIYLYILLL